MWERCRIGEVEAKLYEGVHGVEEMADDFETFASLKLRQGPWAGAQRVGTYDCVAIFGCEEIEVSYLAGDAGYGEVRWLFSLIGTVFPSEEKRGTVELGYDRMVEFEMSEVGGGGVVVVVAKGDVDMA